MARESRSAIVWRTLQVLAVITLSVVLAGLITWPDATLAVLWNVIIPLVPASLLLSPALWRNICPLATANLALNWPSGRKLEPGAHRVTGVIAFALLFLLVPARRFLFNTDGVVLAAVIGAVVALAVVSGLLFDAKAGFCNAICPLLPVERLYGQRPLLRIANPRCVPCTLCTVQGCLDLSPPKSVAHVLGRARASHAWLRTGFGAFAAAFPGFVVGYFTTVNVPLREAPGVYLHVALWCIASVAATAVIARLFRIDATRALTLLAATAALIYYWFSATAMADTLRLGDVGTVGLRLAAAGLVIYWLTRSRHLAPAR